MLPKVNKADMAGSMEAFEEYLRSHHGVIRAPLTYIIRKTIIVHTYGGYPMYVTPDNRMIARMLHLTQARTSSSWSIMFTQSRNVQPSTRETIELSVISWIRSVRIQICIHMSSSISPRGTAEEHFRPSIPGG